MPYATSNSCLLSVTLLLAIVGCSKQSEDVAASDETTAGQSCSLTEQEMARVRMSALEYVMAEWPKLDVLCEEIGYELSAGPNGSCAISGGPVEKPNCPAPAERRYEVVFDMATLEPTGVVTVPPET